MEKLDWIKHFPYREEYLQAFFEKVEKIKTEKGNAPSFEDFRSADILHPGDHDGVDKFFADYQIKPHAFVLEVGCGLGGTSRHLHYTYGVNIFGIDYVEGLVRGSIYLNNLLKAPIQHVQGDACTYPYEAAAFDVAIAIGVFMHIDSDEGILNTCRALKSGGLLYIEDYYFVKSRQEFTEEDQSYVTIRHMYGVRTKQEMQGILARAGMEVLELSEFGEAWSVPAWQRADRFLRDHRASRIHTTDKELYQYTQVSTLHGCDLQSWDIERVRLILHKK